MSTLEGQTTEFRGQGGLSRANTCMLMLELAFLYVHVHVLSMATQTSLFVGTESASKEQAENNSNLASVSKRTMSL